MTYLPITSALADIQAHQATYDVIKSGLNLGTMTAQLSLNGNQYNYNRKTQAAGLASMLSGDQITEQAQGQLNNDQFQPRSYLYHHKNKRKERRDQFQFVSPNSVKGQRNGEAYQLNVPIGTLDPASMELKLANDLINNRPLTYKVTEKGEMRQYNFQRLGNETVDVPAGQYACVKVQVMRDNNERQTTLWLAPDLNYTPVQIRHSEKADVVETQLREYNAR